MNKYHNYIKVKKDATHLLSRQVKKHLTDYKIRGYEIVVLSRHSSECLFLLK